MILFFLFNFLFLVSNFLLLPFNVLLLIVIISLLSMMMLLVTRKTVEGTIQRNTRVEEQKKNKKSPKNSIEELSIVGTNLSSSAVSILSCRRPLQHGVGYRRLRWISRLGRGHHHHHHHHHHRWRPMMMMMMMMMATMMLRLRPLCA